MSARGLEILSPPHFDPSNADTRSNVMAVLGGAVPCTYRGLYFYDNDTFRLAVSLRNEKNFHSDRRDDRAEAERATLRMSTLQSGAHRGSKPHSLLRNLSAMLLLDPAAGLAALGASIAEVDQALDTLPGNDPIAIHFHRVRDLAQSRIS